MIFTFLTERSSTTSQWGRHILIVSNRPILWPIAISAKVSDKFLSSSLTFWGVIQEQEREGRNLFNPILFLLCPEWLIPDICLEKTKVGMPLVLKKSVYYMLSIFERVYDILQSKWVNINCDKIRFLWFRNEITWRTKKTRDVISEDHGDNSWWVEGKQRNDYYLIIWNGIWAVCWGDGSFDIWGPDRDRQSIQLLH